MEIKYGNEGFDKLMEKYNFDSPIEVTLIIEDEDPPEPVLSKDLFISKNTNIPNTNLCLSSTEPYNRTDSNINTQWQLLDTVADNLIHITKYHYYNFVNINMQMEDKERLKFEYITFKHHFFNLSYNTTVALLLPRENDKLFLNDFIHRVIAIANRISWFQISYEILDMLICDMFIWTKRKKIDLDIRFGSRNFERGGMHWSSSAVKIINRLNHSRQILNRLFDNDPTSNHTTQGIKTKPDIVPKTHLPAQVMNISSNIRNTTNYSAQELTRLNFSPRKNNSIKYIDNQISIGHMKYNAKPKRTKKVHNNCSKTFQSQPEINISPRFVQRINHSNQGTSSPLNINRTINNSTQRTSILPHNGSRTNHSTETITSIYNNEPKTNNFSTCQAINTNTNKILLSTGPPNQEITISVDTKILDNINQQYANQINNNVIECHVNEANATKSRKRRKRNINSCCPNSNSNSVPQHNDNDLQYKRDNCSATTFMTRVDGLCHDDPRKAEYELFNTDTMRSSISRDSGFGSPIYGSSRNDQTIETPTNEEQETQIFPHVTSMNPNDDHLNIRYCKVCGATTNSMCIGCYKEYYCSYLCQTKDWEKHMDVCSG